MTSRGAGRDAAGCLQPSKHRGARHDRALLRRVDNIVDDVADDRGHAACAQARPKVAVLDDDFNRDYVENFNPTKEDVAEHAAALGCGLQEAKELLWAAQQMLLSQDDGAQHVAVADARRPAANTASTSAPARGKARPANREGPPARKPWWTYCAHAASQWRAQGAQRHAPPKTPGYAGGYYSGLGAGGL